MSEMVTNLSSIMQDLVATSDEGQSKGRLKTLIDLKKCFCGTFWNWDTKVESPIAVIGNSRLLSKDTLLCTGSSDFISSVRVGSDM